MKSYLGQLRPSAVRVGLADGLRKAKERLDAQAEPDMARVVHVLSDFRAVDWAEDGEAIRQAVKDLTAAGVKVHLIDVAHPYRKDDKTAAAVPRQRRRSSNSAREPASWPRYRGRRVRVCGSRTSAPPK